MILLIMREKTCMSMRLLKIVFFCVLLSTSGYCAYTAVKETEIRDEIITSASPAYDPVSRPAAITTINVGLNLLSIDELDLPAQKFSAAGWLTMDWEDDRLMWNPATKDDIDVIYAKPATVWKPELVLDNSIDDVGVIADSNLLVSIESDGTKATVEWEPLRLFDVHCEVDITYYPYDQQKCVFEVVSWGYTTSQVVLAHMFEEINLEDYRPNGEWEVTKTSVSTSTIHETRNGVTKSFSQLDFYIYLQRRDQFYNTNVMLPIILSSILVTLVFLVPVESGEKLSYILTVLLTIAVFLTIIGDTLPAISLTTSILGIFLAATLVVAALATFVTVWILYIYHKKGEPRPGSIVYILSRGAGKICCWKDINNSGNSVEPMENKLKESGRTSRTGSQSYHEGSLSWIQIAQIWDKFCLIIFVVVTFILDIVFILLLAVGGANKTLD